MRLSIRVLRGGGGGGGVTQGRREELLQMEEKLANEASPQHVETVWGEQSESGTSPQAKNFEV